MGNDKFSNTKRTSLFAVVGLMLVSAILYWLCDSELDAVVALCLASAGLCFFAAGLNAGDK